MAKEPSMNLNKEINLKKISFFKKSLNLNRKSIKKNNFILFSSILIVLLKQILPKYNQYIEIKVNEKGRNQILSNEYIGDYPYVSGVKLTTKYYNFSSTDASIKFEWSNKFSDFSYMFNNLKTITYIKIYDMFNGKINLSNMFRNCINLETFLFESSRTTVHNIENMYGMFYNCSSLNTFSFDNLNLDYYDYDIYYDIEGHINYRYYYYKINMSYMFYNCSSLQTIENSYQIKIISDLSYIFCNCISLESINLINFKTDGDLYINLSYMFYNCHELITITSGTTNFYLKNMNYMFYNCSKLSYVNLNYFSSNNQLNMSYLFYNCQNLSSITI